MIFRLNRAETLKEKATRVDKWHRWFAWHPARISDNEVIWLEPVMRRADLITNREERYWKWEYRPLTFAEVYQGQKGFEQ